MAVSRLDPDHRRLIRSLSRYELGRGDAERNPPLYFFSRVGMYLPRPWQTGTPAWIGVCPINVAVQAGDGWTATTRGANRGAVCSQRGGC
jgi:hypothetical protein